ncbi:MAG: hypothetical protein AB7I50_15545 [Vicinamibacterales bacterium]
MGRVGLWSYAGIGSLVFASGLSVTAQAPGGARFPLAPDPPAELLELKNFLPFGPPSDLRPSAVPNLSGSWLATPYQSISMADRPGAQRGKEKDIAYQPWALQRTLSELPPTGPEGQPDKTTDPWIRFCESNGPLRAYAHPTRTQFLQFPDRVLMLHELMQTFRIIRLNSTHPPLEDLDPSAWGDSIGWYENGDTFVIDTIGLNGRGWLDQMGHPMTVKAHIIERYTLTPERTLNVRRIIDDPGAYLKPIEHTIALRPSTVPFMQAPWNCSVRDNTHFTDTLLRDAAGPAR